jgi:predicted dehydrogenase
MPSAEAAQAVQEVAAKMTAKRYFGDQANTELAQKYADQYGANNLTFSEVINDLSIDGVVLAVPAPFHASLAIKAINAGKHVYVEKPLAMNQLEAEQMIAVSETQNVSLMVGHLLQYHPGFIKVREIVESGDMGVLRYIYSNRLSFGKVRTEEDVIWSFSPHDISMILSLTDQEPKLVRTESSSILQTDIADSAILHLEFSSGLKAHVSVSWLHPCKEQKLVVIGESGMIIFDDTQPWSQKVALYPHKLDVAGKSRRLEKSDVQYINLVESEPLRNECKHFLDVVNEGVMPLTDGNEGLRVLNVLSAATISQNENNTVAVKSL